MTKEVSRCAVCNKEVKSKRKTCSSECLTILRKENAIARGGIYKSDNPQAYSREYECHICGEYVRLFPDEQSTHAECPHCGAEIDCVNE